MLKLNFLSLDQVVPKCLNCGYSVPQVVHIRSQRVDLLGRCHSVYSFKHLYRSIQDIRLRLVDGLGSQNVFFDHQQK